MNIYVSNISFHTTEEVLREMFSVYGEVSSVRIVTDKDTGQSRGFGFIEMSSHDAAEAAIKALDSKEIQGRALRVSMAKHGGARSMNDQVSRSR
ncbi:MAG: RNA-binding protein [Chitinophagaceae bacterium]|jgi:RNA recognition motif-containing protein|nr:RNA-binding protein [Chitinophagaceae bacterium]